MKQKSKLNKFGPWYGCVILALSAQSAWSAISVQSFSAATNDRFANHLSFVGAGYDFSGVGRDALGHWAVMLSPTVFLSANHHRPVGSLIFYGGNDPTATPQSIAIDEGQRIGGTDLYIGRLESPVSAAIKNYSFVTVPPGSINTLANAFVFMSGISPTTSGYGSGSPDVTDQTVGTNRIEGFQAGLTVGDAVGDIIYTIRNLSGDGLYGYGVTSYEAQLAGGDSGSPLFAISGGNLVVAGISWAVGSLTTVAGPRDFSAFTYTGSYAGDIQDYVELAVVPEPASVMLISIAGILLGARRRR